MLQIAFLCVVFRKEKGKEFSFLKWVVPLLSGPAA
jgi:hypothetical protein